MSDSSSSSDCAFFNWVLQAPRARQTAAAPKARILCCCMENLPLSVERAPFSLIRHAERHEPIEQIVIGYPSRPRRFREVFLGFEVWVRVGLQHVDLAVLRDAEVHARAP